MRHLFYLSPVVAFCWATLPAPAKELARGNEPIVSPQVVWEERGGLVAVEAEHFYQQTETAERAFVRFSADHQPVVSPDSDAPHVAGASGGSYVEVLPDTRVTHDDPLAVSRNFSNVPGELAVLSYRVWFNTPGRYYVWVRHHSVGTEDNGVHVGIDGQWPESGRRWQTTHKGAWHWDCRQRTETNHQGELLQLYLDVAAAGLHEIMFSMREDGFEMDKWVMARDREFRPEGLGPPALMREGAK